MYQVLLYLLRASKLLSHVQLFETPWIVAPQASLSQGLFRQEYWSGLPFPSPGDLPDPLIEPTSLALAGRFFTTEPPGKYVMAPMLIKLNKTYPCLSLFIGRVRQLAGS